MICEGESEEEECKTVYESQCETRYHPHEVEDDVVECEETFEEKCVPETQGNLWPFLALFGPFWPFLAHLATITLNFSFHSHFITTTHVTTPFAKRLIS